MCGWRSKILLSLIIYSAGFATAIYTLAPASERYGESYVAAGTVATGSNIQCNSQKLAHQVNVGMHKFISFAEEKAVQVGKHIRAELAEQRKISDK